MMDTTLTEKLLDASWYNAASLHERFALRRRQHRITPAAPPDSERAARRLQRWQNQTPFNTMGYLEQRLVADQANMEEFLSVLGEPPTCIRERCTEPPTWLSIMHEAFARFAPQCFPEQVSFFDVVLPIFDYYRQRLSSRLHALKQEHPDAPFEITMLEQLVWPRWKQQTSLMLSRALVLEMHVARLQGHLEGETPEDRFRNFIFCMRDPHAALSFFQEYPVLARLVCEGADRWVDAIATFTQRLCIDWQAICATFCPTGTHHLLDDLRVASDFHCQGQAVMIATFSSGFRLVYKPKSLAIEAHFQELLRWLNHQGIQPAFRTINVLNCDSHAWVEYVEAQACSDITQIQRFYRRQGAFLAILYALQATDFHCENVIAAGEHPILIDLESLFHPNLAETAFHPINEHSPGYSVLQIGLLPQRLLRNKESEGIDISGLGATTGQLSPTRAPYWEQSGTDQMHLEHKRIPIEVGAHRPVLHGQHMQAVEYTHEIIEGFTQVYRFFLSHQDALLADNSPLMQFRNDEIRVIARPTHHYARLLGESFHPDVLRDAIDRDRLFDRLWLAVEDQPHLAHLIAAERLDLWNGDIPFFSTRPDTCALWDSRGVQIAGFFRESGFAGVQRRITSLSESDLARQIWFIRASLASMTTTDTPWIPRSKISTETMASAAPDELLVAAQRVGDRLEELALRRKTGVNWLGLSLVGGKGWLISPCGMDLYSGRPGILLFLSYLGQATRKERYHELARHAYSDIQHAIERYVAKEQAIGAYHGLGGLLYTLTHLGVIWDEPALLDQAVALVPRIGLLIEQDRNFDLVSGAAGCIAGLLCLYKERPTAEVLQAAIQCGKHLCNSAIPVGNGIGWPTNTTAAHPLTGFSHGAAGIAWALLPLALRSGDEKLRQSAMAAIRYERSTFRADKGNWPDFRTPPSRTNGHPNEYPCMTTWCHGAPGIGLSRLLMLPYLDDMTLVDEITIALETTRRYGFEMNHSLCHGTLGNLETFLTASRYLSDDELSVTTYRLAKGILQSIEQQGWQCGVPFGIETPGLMTGLAGIGYELLRLALPNQIPSVLTLEPPVQARYRSADTHPSPRYTG